MGMILARKGSSIVASAECDPSKELVNVMVESFTKQEDAISFLEMLEDKSNAERATAAELAGVRCILKNCASNLDIVLKDV